MSPRARRITGEAALQRSVTDLLDLQGWTWVHFPKVRVATADRRAPGGIRYHWRTPFEGPGGPGFPDLLAWRERVIFLELKGPRTGIKPEQPLRHEELRNAGVEVHLFRLPRDWPLLEAVVARPGAAPVAHREPLA